MKVVATILIVLDGYCFWRASKKAKVPGMTKKMSDQTARSPGIKAWGKATSRWKRGLAP